ncbi:hypothetical protein OUQ_0280 [Helicobacter pylori R055a]|nr:hypothetical protein OUQ_0280 [Helicobacter pylori R055a]
MKSFHKKIFITLFLHKINADAMVFDWHLTLMGKMGKLIRG